MRDYSSINRSFTNRNNRRTSLPSSTTIDNNENIVNGQATKVDELGKGMKKEENYKPKVRIQIKKDNDLKEKSNETGIKRSPKRTALGDIKQGSSTKKPQSSVVASEKSDIKDDKSDSFNEKEAKNATIQIKTPSSKKLKKSEDESVEATNQGYASVSKLAEWLAERPFDSAKKVTRTVPPSCPVTQKNPPKRKDLNGTKKTLFSTGENGKASKPGIPPKSKPILKPISLALPAENKGPIAKSGVKAGRPPTGSLHNFLIRKETKDNEEVQATNEGYATVRELSHWLAEKPFDTKKKVVVSKKGKNVLEKSLAFEPDQPIPTEYVFQKEIKKYNNVSDKKNWLKNQAFTKDH